MSSPSLIILLIFSLAKSNSSGVSGSSLSKLFIISLINLSNLFFHIVKFLSEIVFEFAVKLKFNELANDLNQCHLLLHMIGSGTPSGG